MENKTTETARLPLKTDDPRFDRADFIQTECGTMKELTVTITLAEYRSLVKDLAYWQQKAVAAADKARQLQAENFARVNPDA